MFEIQLTAFAFKMKNLFLGVPFMYLYKNLIAIDSITWQIWNILLSNYIVHT